MRKKLFYMMIFASFPAFAWMNDWSPDFQRDPVRLEKLSEKADLPSEAAKLIPKLELPAFAIAPEFYRADLNGDGKPDYLMKNDYPGCGIMSQFKLVYFVLSSPDGYKLTMTGSMNFELNDIVRIGNRSCYVQTALLYGKEHNYWHNRLFSFEKDGRLKNADHLVSPFPSYVWYTFKPNHKQSASLTPEDRFEMWNKMQDVYWMTKKNGNEGTL